MSLYGSLARNLALSDLDDKATARTNLGITGGSYTVVTADDTANAITIVTGLSSISAFLFEIIRTGADVRNAATSAAAGGSVIVADAGTYAATAGDVVRWIAVGTK